MPTTIKMMNEGSESAIKCDRYVLVAWNEEEGERSAAVVHCNSPVLPEPSLEIAIKTLAGALTHSGYPQAIHSGSYVLAALASASSTPGAVEDA